MSKKHPQIGGLFEDWLKQEGIQEEVANASIKRVLAWQLDKAMKEGKINKSEMAKLMDTSRPQLDRLLDPENGNVTLDTLSKAAKAVGRRIRLELV